MPKPWHRALWCLWAIGLSIVSVRAEDVVSLAQRLNHSDKVERREAAYQLLQAGERAAPVINQLIRALDDEDVQVWYRATMTLAAIGPKAHKAIPDLIRHMGGEGVRYGEQSSHRSAFALSRIGETALPALTEALADDNALRRHGAVSALGMIGVRAASGTMSAVLALLGDESEAVRKEASETLVIYGESSLPALLERLNDESTSVRAQAAYTIGRFGPGAITTRLALMNAFHQNDDDSVRAACLKALVACKADLELITPWLIESLLEEGDMREAAIDAILNVQNPSAHLVPALASLLTDRDEANRLLVADVLSRIGPDSQSAAHVIIARIDEAALSDAEKESLTKALIAMGPVILPQIFSKLAASNIDAISEASWPIIWLKALGPRLTRSIEAALPPQSPTLYFAILEALSDYPQRSVKVQQAVMGAYGEKHPKIRAAATRALHRIRLAPRPWERAMKRALRDEAPEVRLAALRALPRSPLSQDALRQALIDALDQEPEVRLAAVEEIAKLGEEGKPAEKALMGLLGASDPILTKAVVKAFGAMKSSRAEVMETMIGYLKLSDSELQEVSLKALASIGTPAQKAIPTVKAMFEHEQLGVNALEAFAKIETDPKQLVPVFLDAVAHESPDYRQPAIEGLSRLGEKAAPAAPSLFKLLSAQGKDDRRLILGAIREMRVRDVDLILSVIENDDPVVRLYACDQLGRLGKDAEKAVPELRKALRDDYSFVRRRAGEALRKITGEESRRHRR